MNNGSISVIASLGLAMFSGCAQENNAGIDALGDESVASIDGIPIQTTLFNFYARGRVQKNAELLTDEEYDGLLQELIEFRILARAAETQGLASGEEVLAGLEIQRLQALSRVMASNYLEENPASEAELQLAYQQNLSQLSGPEYKARHILLDTEDEARIVIEELQQGADFQELARTKSTGPSGPDGGELDWFTPNSMVAPFANAVGLMDMGTFTEEPVETQYGWHVILLEDAVHQPPPGLDAVRDEITSFVEERRIREYLESLIEAAEITYGGSESTPE
jgi:peptidyl-prolyl cis-trans isomerase C